MPLPRKELPNVGEYVVATVKKIFDYGAYVVLDEYNGLEAYLPWSEVASRWVRNIRDVIRENQKIVVKVIRVNRRRKTVDVSLKKVPENEKRKKMLWWKRYLKASKLIELVAEKIGKSIEDAYKEVVWKLEDYYGDPLLGLEEAVMRGPEALREAGIPEEWIEPLYSEARRHIRIKMVKIRGVLFLRSYESDGVERIRKILLSAREIIDNAGDNIKGKIYLLGSPRYVIEITAPEYKEAEKVLQKIIERIEDLAKELKVEYRFERERK
jgi:translation initiation factor 2 subunit 1